jgi:plastocyanin
MRILRNWIAGAAILALGLGLGMHNVAVASHPGAAAHRQVIATEANGQYAFSPKTLSIKAGTQVTWKNTSDAPHTVTGKGSWSSFNKQLPAGKSVSFTFKKAGTYKYYCAIHPYMVATIKVK